MSAHHASPTGAPRTEPIPVHERLIVALDVPDIAKAKALVERLDDTVTFYKLGLELAASGRYFELLDWLLARDKRVFADWKLYDIPATVAAAVRQLAGCGASLLTVHGDRAIMEAAAEHQGDSLKVLAVTVLTSIGQDDLKAMGIEMSVDELTLLRASQAVAAGCDGIIASGLEVEALRARIGRNALIVTPGIRPKNAAGGDDQKRIVTAEQSFKAGADYIVVGRPIRQAPDPYAAAAAFQDEIAAVFR
ncbi:MAG: orotidine-5'-phosphate decarboxylase [Gammaproteobacteria bacterium]|nr:orotidine-5'-phosphate decarboxylase [Gammaproteobacteria bacterium]